MGSGHSPCGVSTAMVNPFFLRDADCAHIDLVLIQGVDRQAREDMDEDIKGRPVAAVLHSHLSLQLSQEGFDDGAWFPPILSNPIHAFSTPEGHWGPEVPLRSGAKSSRQQNSATVKIPLSLMGAWEHCLVPGREICWSRPALSNRGFPPMEGLTPQRGFPLPWWPLIQNSGYIDVHRPYPLF